MLPTACLRCGGISAADLQDPTQTVRVRFELPFLQGYKRKTVIGIGGSKASFYEITLAPVSRADLCHLRGSEATNQGKRL